MSTRRKSKKPIIQVNTTASGHIAAVLDTTGFEPLSNYGGFGKGLFGRGLFGKDPGSIQADTNTSKIIS